MSAGETSLAWAGLVYLVTALALFAVGSAVIHHGYKVWQSTSKRIARATCAHTGHRFCGLDAMIKEAVYNTGRMATQYGAERIVAIIHGPCCRCGENVDPIMQIEGYLIDGEWKVLSEEGVHA